MERAGGRTGPGNWTSNAEEKKQALRNPDINGPGIQAMFASMQETGIPTSPIKAREPKLLICKGCGNLIPKTVF